MQNVFIMWRSSFVNIYSFRLWTIVHTFGVIRAVGVRRLCATLLGIGRELRKVQLARYANAVLLKHLSFQFR
jgi:hypothetical protein